MPCGYAPLSVWHWDGRDLWTCVFALTALFNHQIVAMFIDRSYPAYDIAVAGLPLFASGFIFLL